MINCCQREDKFFMNVLSLFDGISCARLALEKADITIEKYYASEICNSAIRISNDNFNDIIRLGDVKNWRSWNLEWSDIDLIVAGSPCQGFSRAGKELNFKDDRSGLFFIFVDILNHAKTFNKNIKFLLENVKMRKEFEDVITELIGVQPILIDGKNGFLQARPRVYWFNFSKKSEYVGDFKNITCILDINTISKVYKISDNKRVCGITEDERGFRPHRGDIRKTGISEIGRILKHDAAYTDTITTTHAPKILMSIAGNDIYYRVASITECEKLNGLPIGYTKSVSPRQALKAIGNGWHVDIVAEIFEGLKL